MASNQLSNARKIYLQRFGKKILVRKPNHPYPLPQPLKNSRPLNPSLPFYHASHQTYSHITSLAAFIATTFSSSREKALNVSHNDI